jgi:hypothetical protein
MLAAIGLDRDTAYITNMIPWRPPGNRTPAAHEIELCRPFIERHIALAQPKVLVMLGNIASKSLLDTDKGILSVRGNWMDCKTGRPTDPCPADPASGLPAAQPVAEAAGMGGFPVAAGQAGRTRKGLRSCPNGVAWRKYFNNVAIGPWRRKRTCHSGCQNRNCNQVCMIR